MKRIITLLIAIMYSIAVLFAQDAPPQAFSFKATIVSNTGTIVSNRTVSIRLSIIKNNNNGISVFTETFSPKTNDYGQVDILIGNGSRVSGNFSAIEWAYDKYFLKVEVDVKGGKNYILMSVTQLLSVPYAMYAKTAGSVTGGVSEKDPVFGSSAAKGISASNITNWNNAYGWGNHASFGYLKKYTETDPIWTAASANYYTRSNLQTSGASRVHFGNLTNKPTTLAGYGITDGANGSWENLTGKPTTLSGFGITDAMNISHAANGITAINITNWNTAFGWGDHEGLYRPLNYVPAWSEITSNPFSFTSVANNQLIKYNSTTGKWENWTPDFTSGSIENDPVFTAWNKSTGISITAAQVSDFQNSVTNNSAVMANSAKISYPLADATKLAGIAAGAEVNVNSDWNAISGDAQILNKPALAAVATSGSYNNLTDKPILFGGAWNDLTGKPATIAGFGITDAMTTTHAANGITSGNIGNWNTAFGWGDHEGLYRPLNYVPAWSEITSNPFSFTSVANNQMIKYNSTTGKWENWTPDFTSGFTETDPVFTAWNKSTGISIKATQVSDFQSSVTNNAAVLSNSAKISYPLADATKLAGIAAGAEVNVQPDWNQTTNTADDFIKNKPIIPTAADGSETKVTAGANVTVTGSGTTGSPYVVNSTGTTALTIGQSYQGGIIFWLDATGQHGLIASTANQNMQIEWCNGTANNRITGTSGDGLYAGAMNTTLAVATQMADNQAGNFAAKVCADYSVTVDGITYGDWYLPSKYELNLLYLQKTNVGGFDSWFYWSSTESGIYNAWMQIFDTGGGYTSGYQSDGYKNGQFRVRAIRAF